MFFNKRAEWAQRLLEDVSEVVGEVVSSIKSREEPNVSKNYPPGGSLEQLPFREVLNKERSLHQDLMNQLKDKFPEETRDELDKLEHIFEEYFKEAQELLFQNAANEAQKRVAENHQDEPATKKPKI